jgi:hypothetical protein
MICIRSLIASHCAAGRVTVPHPSPPHWLVALKLKRVALGSAREAEHDRANRLFLTLTRSFLQLHTNVGYRLNTP